MRLQIEHDLQPVLDLAEKRVVLFQDRPLQVRQAADAIELGKRFQRIAGTQLGQIAAVEQLEKLDDELDVADAAAAGFHVAGKNGDWLRALMRRQNGSVRDDGTDGEASVPVFSVVPPRRAKAARSAVSGP